MKTCIHVYILQNQPPKKVSHHMVHVYTCMIISTFRLMGAITKYEAKDHYFGIVTNFIIKPVRTKDIRSLKTLGVTVCYWKLHWNNFDITAWISMTTCYWNNDSFAQQMSLISWKRMKWKCICICNTPCLIYNFFFLAGGWKILN